jgi:hypothetical protein
VALIGGVINSNIGSLLIEDAGIVALETRRTRYSHQVIIRRHRNGGNEINEHTGAG